MCSHAEVSGVQKLTASKCYRPPNSVWPSDQLRNRFIESVSLAAAASEKELEFARPAQSPDVSPTQQLCDELEPRL